MKTNFTKWIIAFVFIVTMLGIGIFAFVSSRKPPTPPFVVKNVGPIHTIIGQSLEGRSIDAYTYSPAKATTTAAGGAVHLLFVGGIHGGYEWNSVLLAYQFMDYLAANPGAIPDNLTVTVIPDANPDGVFKVVGKEGRFTIADVSTDSKILASGRFNADNVDLNRNFDCKWQAKSTWQNKTVSAGAAPFSEPEALALKNYILGNSISAAVFWHSQSNAVYASQCEKGILPATLDIMNTYAKAASYPAVKTFDAYATSGAADDWMASVNIPAVTVELSTHNSIEWDKNLAGIKALFAHFSKK